MIPKHAAEVASAAKADLGRNGFNRPDRRDQKAPREIHLPPSGFVVTPVLGHWREPHPVGVVDTAEVAAVRRLPVAELTDPVNRFTARHPSGYRGPGFEVGGLFVWGFTAGLLDRLLRLAGWERPWDRDTIRPVAD